jgi:hypothetical protein
MALMTTACSRPHYLEASLTSWAQADHAQALSGFAVALGRSGKEAEQLDLVRRMAPGAHIWLDSPQAAQANGMHRAIAEAATRAFNEFAADFLILTEEDLAVSSDIVTYMAWGAEKFAADKRVLAVCSHSPGGQGWDPEPCAPQDGNADQEAVRLLPYFQAWTIGVWRDRWFDLLLPNWDFDCSSGGPMDSGWDFHIATRLLPQWGMLCAVPDASRSQNIGQYGGWAAQPENFHLTQSQSFRERREPPVQYRLVEA